MSRRRTNKTVNSSFIKDAETILDLLNKHKLYLRTDLHHYKALSDLSDHLVQTARELNDGVLPWSQSNTGPCGPPRQC